MLDGKNKHLYAQSQMLSEILSKHSTLWTMLEVLESSGLTNYYLAAGCISQTVWNYYHGYDLSYGIKDIDIVYFDEDISYEAEDNWIRKINHLLRFTSWTLDIKNQARVHLWYEEKYHQPRRAVYCVEEAMNYWGSTITSIGVRLENGTLVVYAPYGLNDLFELIVRPIYDLFPKESYESRSERWKHEWPKLTVLPWVAKGESDD